MASGVKMKNILAMDCETSGLNFSSAKSLSDKSPIHGYQAVSWGMIATNLSYEPLDELYVEIKWNGEAKWDARAEAIHGLSKEYLEENGLDEEDALVEIIEFFMKNFDLKKPIYCLGHNVASFDVPVLKSLFFRHEIPGIRFGHRHFDTFSLGVGTVGTLDSNALFKRVGLPERTDHNSLEDARYALESFKRINKVWNKLIKSAKK